MYNQISYYYISKLKLHVHYGNWEEAIEWGEKASKLLMAFANQPGHFEFEQFYTIAALYRATETENDTAIKLITLAHEGIEKINAWAKHCPSNFLAKALMVKAIKKGIDGEITESEQLFKQAVFEAKKHGFTQDCGLAYEHLMRLQKKQSLDYKHTLISTRKTYEKWGALAKINYIKIEFDN
jgi:tetratricopeptide (TPR) repeat protein